MKLVRLLVCIVATCACLVSASPALACSCMPSTVEEGYKTSDAVFWGVVTKTERLRTGYGSLQATFQVKKWFKGGKQKTVTVNTNAGGTACGLDFVEGDSYVVFAHASQGGLGASSCGHTRQQRTKPTSATKAGPERDFTREKKALEPVLRPILEKAAKVCPSGSQFILTFYANGEFDIDRASKCADEHLFPHLKVPSLPDVYPFKVSVWMTDSKLRKLDFEEEGQIPLLRTNIRQVLDQPVPLVAKADLEMQHRVMKLERDYWGDRHLTAECHLSGPAAARRTMEARVKKDKRAAYVAEQSARTFYECAVFRRDWKTAAKLAPKLEEYEGRDMVVRLRNKTASMASRGLPLDVSLQDLGLTATEVLQFARKSQIWRDDVVLLQIIAQAVLARPAANDEDRTLAAQAYARAALLSDPRSVEFADKSIAVGGEQVLDEMEKANTERLEWARKRWEQEIERAEAKSKTTP